MDNPFAAERNAGPKRLGEASFLLIRHGATKLNKHGTAEDRIRGWENVPLSAEGHREARRLADKLRDSGLEVVYSSDLDRARHTAEAVAQATGAELVMSRKLRPWDLGRFTGQHSADVAKELPEFIGNPDRRVPEGEAFNHFRDRAFEGLGEAIKGAKGRSMAIVTHHRIERLLKAWMAEGQPEDHSVDARTFLHRGEPPGAVEKMTLRASRL